MEPDLEVTRDITASAEALFIALTDITRMGESSPECVRAEWSEGFTKPTVGAM